MEVSFDLQQFLSEMRTEMRDGFNRIDTAASKTREDLVEHEKSDLRVAAETNTRLEIGITELAKIQAALWWTMRTVVAAFIVAGIGLLFAALSK
jgi:hypothetical protein